MRLTGWTQCVLGTVIDSYYRGYDVILVEDATATTSPEGGLENVVYNIGNVSGDLCPTCEWSLTAQIAQCMYNRVMDSSLTPSVSSKPRTGRHKRVLIQANVLVHQYVLGYDDYPWAATRYHITDKHRNR